MLTFFLEVVFPKKEINGHFKLGIGRGPMIGKIKRGLSLVEWNSRRSCPIMAAKLPIDSPFIAIEHHRQKALWAT